MQYQNETPRDKEYVEAYLKFNSSFKAGEVCGVHAQTIMRAVKRANVYSEDGKKICGCCGKEFISRDIRKKFCSRRCKDIDYKRRKGQNSRLDPCHVKCVICGKEFDTFNQSKKTCSDECSKELKKIGYKKRDKKRSEKLHMHSWDEYVLIRKREAEQNAEIKRIEKEKYKIEHTVERECKICNSLFYCLDKETRCTCSPECSFKYKKIKDRIRKDKRLNKNNIIDTDITLDKLYKRDNGICYICGCVCDKSDYVMRDNIKICGKSYPSIDHVLPLARGGKHQWENVRLAHLGCNIDKSDTTPEFTKEMSREYARKMASARCINKRKTAQYTLEGNLIRIWESTAQIKRELGLDNKHIQRACRRDRSNTGNAYGYHWEYVKCQ